MLVAEVANARANRDVVAYNTLSELLQGTRRTIMSGVFGIDAGQLVDFHSVEGIGE